MSPSSSSAWTVFFLNFPGVCRRSTVTTWRVTLALGYFFSLAVQTSSRGASCEPCVGGGIGALCNRAALCRAHGVITFPTEAEAHLVSYMYKAAARAPRNDTIAMASVHAPSINSPSSLGESRRIVCFQVRLRTSSMRHAQGQSSSRYTSSAASSSLLLR